MDEHFEDDRNFMLGLMGKGRGIERVQSRSADVVVPEMITIDLGDRMVEVRHFGFAQTPGDLVVWVPDAKVLWVGNMIQAPSPALPWLLEGRHHDTIETLSRVKAFLPEDATIIPGHGKPMRPSGIDFPLNYLRELDGSVRKAIDEGRSAEEAQNAVAMAHYSDYSLFEWAHRTVNVPAAYSHLRDKATE
jgi:glyoxylase-like metal-dependent hydrolase (beta-lactamase superfamily II)